MTVRSVEEHLQSVLAGVVPLSPLDVTLVDARGCVLAEDVTAPWPLPPFDNASMDGYAVKAADLLAASDGKPVTLRVIDDVPAGYRASVELREGAAIRIMTGAPLPEGAEAIVPIEWTDGGMPEVRITRSVNRGAHVRRRGDDVALGEVVATAGTVLGPREIALLAAVGRGRVSVHPQPRVVIISTGSELVEPGQPLSPGTHHRLQRRHDRRRGRRRREPSPTASAPSSTTPRRCWPRSRTSSCAPTSSSPRAG